MTIIIISQSPESPSPGYRLPGWPPTLILSIHSASISGVPTMQQALLQVSNQSNAHSHTAQKHPTVVSVRHEACARGGRRKGLARQA